MNYGMRLCKDDTITTLGYLVIAQVNEISITWAYNRIRVTYALKIGRRWLSARKHLTWQYSELALCLFGGWKYSTVLSIAFRCHGNSFNISKARNSPCLRLLACWFCWSGGRFKVSLIQGLTSPWWFFDQLVEIFGSSLATVIGYSTTPTFCNRRQFVCHHRSQRRRKEQESTEKIRMMSSS